MSLAGSTVADAGPKPSRSMTRPEGMLSGSWMETISPSPQGVEAPPQSAASAASVA